MDELDTRIGLQELAQQFAIVLRRHFAPWISGNLGKQGINQIYVLVTYSLKKSSSVGSHPWISSSATQQVSASQLYET
jgi:hypothetical protein